MRIRTTRRRLLGFVAVLVALLFGGPLGGQAAYAIYMPYPGLPEPDPSITAPGWYWAQQAGMSETAKADQYVAVPPLTLVSVGGTIPLQQTVPGEQHFTSGGNAAFVSPPGAPKPYGYMPPLRVRTVGFGMLPSEATIQISQRFDHGQVVPVHAQFDYDYYSQGSVWQSFPGMVVKDAFNVRVTKVTMDGVSVGLTGNCHTVTPAPVQMTAPAYTIPMWVKDQNLNTETYLRDDLGIDNYFSPVFGGTLDGTIDIPPFTGCTTKTGDDLSSLLTLSASGPGNKVTTRVVICGDDKTFLPPAPGDWDKWPFSAADPTTNYCRAIGPDEMIPYPTRSKN